MDEMETATHQSYQRRGSMSNEEERERRASIKAILADTSIPEVERRRSIQQLMDGRRTSLGSRCSTPPSTDVDSGTEDMTSDEYGHPPPPLHASSYMMTNNNNNNNSTTAAAPYATTNMLNSPTATAGPGGLTPEAMAMLSGEIHPYANEQTKRAELTRPCCDHYDRKCTMIAPCCGAAFGCRICHDDCPVLPPKIEVQQARRRYPRSSSLPSSFTSMDATPEDTHHTIDRFAVREVICRECFTRQSSKT